MNQLLFIALLFYLTGCLIVSGYSVQLYKATRANLKAHIKLILSSWYSIGKISGRLLIEKRTMEQFVLEAQRKQQEQIKHGIIKPTIITPH